MVVCKGFDKIMIKYLYLIIILSNPLHTTTLRGWRDVKDVVNWCLIGGPGVRQDVKSLLIDRFFPPKPS